MKKVALKSTKALLTEAEAKAKSIPNADIAQSWRGRCTILNAEKSVIAARMGVEENGEFAIKVN